MNSDTTLVWTSAPRKTAQIHFPNGRTFEAPIGTQLEHYFRSALGESQVPYVAGLVNGTLRELTYKMWTDAAVEPLFLSDGVGCGVKEVAEILGCPVGAAKARIIKARSRLRDLLDSRTPVAGPALYRS